jgi:branched-chain amino acid transport system permease protein
VVSAAAAGLAGAISALHQNLVSTNDAYGMMISVFPIMMAMVGGARSFFGPIYGALFFAVLEEFSTRFTEQFELILGVVLIVVIMYWPLGFAGMILKIKFKWLTRKRLLRFGGGVS